MKKLSVLILLSLSISACDWIEKNKIEKTIIESYSVPVCLEWNIIKQQKDIVDALEGQGLLVKRKAREPEGIMGYMLSFQYAPKDQKSLCYGTQFVEEIKSVDFDGAMIATVSFVTDTSIKSQWAKKPEFKKYITLGKQLRRMSVIKIQDKWEIISTQKQK